MTTSKPCWSLTRSIISSSIDDQQLGGLMVPGGMFFLIPLIGVLAKLLNQEPDDQSIAAPLAQITRNAAEEPVRVRAAPALAGVLAQRLHPLLPDRLDVNEQVRLVTHDAVEHLHAVRGQA